VPALEGSPRLARFQDFELDLRAGELRSNGREAIRLGEQPLQILVALLEKPGEVVLREEIRKRLWPNDTVVEFEHSISAAMNRLRQALGDSADEPRYIETLARRGYRWMIPVEWVDGTRKKDASVSATTPQTRRFTDNLVGKKVSHYRILEVLGGGGMGVVYKAEDLKLGRCVALKFLGEELIGDYRALERFEREARTISALDHANICTIYEVEEHEGQPFIVMQLLQGQTLRQRIESGGTAQPAFSPSELVDFGLQIVTGLEAAHQKGILHRDVKPANIFVTNRGEMKLLDFGLAKLIDTGDDFHTGTSHQERTPSEISQSSMTLTGAMMGTASYMSPEQVRKEPLDARSDLFSFGVVLYEMATGLQPFRGDDVHAIHEAVLHHTPPSPLSLNPMLPPELEPIISKALEKDRQKRYQSASEIISDLQHIHTLKSGAAPPHVDASNPSAFAGQLRWPVRPRLPGGKGLVLLALFLGVLGLTVVFISLKSWSQSSLPKVVDSAQITKDGLPKSNATSKLVSDGNRLYFQEGSLDDTEKKTRLLQVSAQGGETALIPVALQNPMAFDFSEVHSELLVGGGELATLGSERPLWGLPIPAGPPHRLGDILAHDACWSPNGRHVAFANGKDVFVAAKDGSEVHKLATPDDYDFSFWIRFSPDEKRVRFSVARSGRPSEEMEIMEVAANGTGLHRLPVQGGCCGTWSADGKYYFYHKGRDIWVLPERSSLFGEVETGAPVQLTAGPLSFDSPTPSPDGKHLFVVGSQQRIELVRYDSRSRQFSPFLGGISAGELEVSPDGQWVTYTTFPESDLWRSKIDGSERLQLTFAPINAHEPRWSPDGKQILFSDFPHKLLIIPANGGTPRQLMPTDQPPLLIGAGAWMPDGNSIIFGRRVCSDITTCLSICRLDLTTQHVSKVPDSDGMVGARLSHDGRYLTALPMPPYRNKLMLYDFKTQRWSELAKAFGSVAWSRNSRFVYVHLKHESEPDELVRISVPDGKVRRLLDLKGVTLGGKWPDWISLLPDDSPLLMLSRSVEEIYRLDLESR
jgi:eukaryotic-like serine/threonine-protein kinase